MVIGRRVTGLMDKVLKGFGAAEEAGIKNRINFMMFFTIHEVGKGRVKLGPWVAVSR